MQMSGS